MDTSNLFTYLFFSIYFYLFISVCINRCPYTSNSFNSMTKLQHTFTLTVAGPSSCGKSTFVIRPLENREQLCDVFTNIVVSQ